MAWFGRRGGDEGPVSDEPAPGRPPRVEQREFQAQEDSLGGDGPLRPVTEAVPPEQQQRIADGVAAVEAEGVDVEDLVALGAGLDAALRDWLGQPESSRTGHDAVVERYAMAAGEHLARHTDLRWTIVTDVFGSDLGLVDSGRGDFVVVPTNLVASRWMRRDSGWLPGVLGHLVRLRTR